MSHYQMRFDKDGAPYLEVNQSGSDLLHNPLLNKGTAFTERERHEFGLVGLLPPHVSTLEEQLTRVYENYVSKPNNIEKYVHLRALQDRNETLFYALLRRHAEEMIPIVYTPTVGEAVQKGSHIFRMSRGLYLSPENIESVDGMIASLPSDKIEVIVVTDNQGILGIGDQGIGGMGIPIGKLSLYTMGAGINPAACLPICLDVGTDNEALLDDPLYLGHKHRRFTGEAYDRFIARFVEKIKRHFPGALLQWEDFSKQNAYTNLDRFRDKTLSFNDDVQGTGAVVLAGILGAMKIVDSAITEQRYVVFGAGAGGMGVARQILAALTGAGLSRKEAGARVFTVDSRGLITTARTDLEEYKLAFATPIEAAAQWKVKDRGRISLLEVIQNGGVTVLLGTSGQPGAFTKEIVQAMPGNAPMPVIFPLSNPTSKAEATPEQVYTWTDGRAIVATGSPFGPVTVGEATFRIGQGNNAFVFPGVGLGALAARARIITDEMFTAAAYRLADMMPADAAQTHCVYPRVADLGKISEQVAMAVYQTGMNQGVVDAPKDADPAKEIQRRVWKPVYLPYRPAKK